jgi:hypothetical protein
MMFEYVSHKACRESVGPWDRKRGSDLPSQFLKPSPVGSEIYELDLLSETS